MNCFIHPTVPAVAVCRTCNKGLCPECGKDGDAGVTCGGRCAEEAMVVRLQTLASARVLKTGGGFRANVVTNFIFAAMFGVLGLWGLLAGSGSLAAFGAISATAFGIAAFQSWKGLKTATQAPSPAAGAAPEVRL